MMQSQNDEQRKNPFEGFSGVRTKQRGGGGGGGGNLVILYLSTQGLYEFGFSPHLSFLKHMTGCLKK